MAPNRVRPLPAALIGSISPLLIVNVITDLAEKTFVMESHPVIAALLSAWISLALLAAGDPF